MYELKIFDKTMQKDIERFFIKCFSDLGWGYEPGGRHTDISDAYKAYMENGCMWCLYDGKLLAGTVAVRNITKAGGEKTAELKRMFVLKEHQGKGYGNLLLETAVAYSRENGYCKILLDSRKGFHAALHLYRKYGFTEIPAYNDNEKAELYMGLKLFHPVR
ncbi:MAG: GNAT family N-acetyltransferase [Oscillospiraceae bacterium]|nr:GNAT family N-acetyltransferase [Oscillospiraceae bacterium]